MSEMVERVAKAIGDAAFKRHGGTLMVWASSPERQDCLVFARAAIEAMREPTFAMVEAGCDYDERTFILRVGRAPTAEEYQADEWSAMIDAALSNEGTKL